MQKKNQTVRLLLALLVLCLVAGGCSGSSSKKEKKQKGSVKIYYLNGDGTKLVSDSYLPKKEETAEQIQELFDTMEKAPEDEDFQPAKPEYVRLLNVNLNNNGQVSINVSKEYSELDGTDEILCRAAIVKTLCQLKGVSFVEIRVEGVPLMMDTEKAIGYEQSSDFIDNIGGEATFYQDVSMTLYFSDQTGKKLMPVHITVNYDGTFPLEKLVVERLIQGPGAIDGVDTDKVLRSIPSKTELVKISVKDEVCYVDLSSEFLNKNPGISNEVTVYSIVNSLAELSYISKVSFTIDGSATSDYRELKNFDKPFERNLDLVQK
ncbi:MAG: GerMN domain-containing protein [Clostridiales bacterium]|nr:GerMN domain-containing protein [Clostridiales bacterium]